MRGMGRERETIQLDIIILITSSSSVTFTEILISVSTEFRNFSTVMKNGS